MLRKIFFITILSTLVLVSCQKDDFDSAYTDPSKISESSVEKQFTGFLKANSEYILPDYWQYFVAFRITHHRYNQTIGWVNGENQYLPGGAAVDAVWSNYYTTLSQYRELENIYNKLNAADQADRKIFMLAAKVYLYEYTQKMVDLHGDIPFSKAGKIGANGGDFDASLPEYDKADAIYKVMLDDLKSIADELATIQLKAGIASGFKTQDYV
ncbi:MAG: SusD/RagB family nutrient-binding outer membrane lipoprotein, partial [Saprospiraceae bacterium]